jgi:hypothetical protein
MCSPYRVAARAVILQSAVGIGHEWRIWKICCQLVNYNRGEREFGLRAR